MLNVIGTILFFMLVLCATVVIASFFSRRLQRRFWLMALAVTFVLFILSYFLHLWID